VYLLYSSLSYSASRIKGNCFLSVSLLLSLYPVCLSAVITLSCLSLSCYHSILSVSLLLSNILSVSNHTTHRLCSKLHPIHSMGKSIVFYIEKGSIWYADTINGISPPLELSTSGQWHYSRMETLQSVLPVVL
jgi:hypothetical protein